MKTYTIISKRIDSYRELLVSIEKQNNILLNNEVKQKKEFFLITIMDVVSDNIVLCIGIVSEGHGIEPQYAFTNNHEIIIGVNHEIYIVSIMTLEKRCKQMDSLFYMFKEDTDLDMILIICEANVYGCNYALESVWEVNSDLVKDFEFLDNCIRIETDSGDRYYSSFDGCEIK
jgi:hypothetical protein